VAGKIIGFQGALFGEWYVGWAFERNGIYSVRSAYRLVKVVSCVQSGQQACRAKAVKIYPKEAAVSVSLGSAKPTRPPATTTTGSGPFPLSPRASVPPPLPLH